MNYLELVNEVLVRLREDEVTAVTDTDYSKLIGVFVNEAKRKVEDSWNWTSLRQNINVTTVSGTVQYVLTGTNKRCRMFGAREAYDDTNDVMLREVDDWFFDRVTYIGTTQSAPPIYFRFRGLSTDAKQVDMYPTPNGIYTVRFPMIVPQTDLTGTTEMTCPDDPVVLGAYSMAVNERGEDGGMSYAVAEQNFRDALGDAISLDTASTDELVWH